MQQHILDRPLMEVPYEKGVGVWTIRNAVEGVQIFGGIGSGKTSGSGRLLALKYLKAGFGGLVLTVKQDEKETWKEYCKLSGRANDLIVLEPGGKHCFNFLQYEASHTDGQQAITENIVEVLKTVIKAGEERNGGKGDDAFWDKSLDMLLFNVVDLCKLAYDRVSVQEMYDIVLTSPRTKKDLEKTVEERAQNAFFKAFDRACTRVIAKVTAWQERAPQAEFERMSNPNYFEEHIGDYVPNYRVLKVLGQFFLETQLSLNDKTRSVIDFMFSGFLFRLLREPIYSLFCRGNSTITPEHSLQGKIILLSLPVKIYHKIGRDCQILFKYIWQRSMEKRVIHDQTTLPVFLWADEAQNFLHEHDAEYQATARSSRIATVYISQNLPNYYASMGGHEASNRIKSFLGTLGTKIFHANADIDTNQYASVLIGDKKTKKETEGGNYNKEVTLSYSSHYEFERIVRPEQFMRLRSGGSLNDRKVDGFIVWQGDSIIRGRSHAKISFSQDSV